MPDLKCVMCDNTTFSENASHCKRCGTPVENRCMSTSCGELNQSDAAFCEYCGFETEYNSLKVVQPYPDPDQPPF